MDWGDHLLLLLLVSALTFGISYFHIRKYQKRKADDRADNHGDRGIEHEEEFQELPPQNRQQNEMFGDDGSAPGPSIHADDDEEGAVLRQSRRRVVSSAVSGIGADVSIQDDGGTRNNGGKSGSHFALADDGGRNVTGNSASSGVLSGMWI